ncbi:alanine racemase [Pseudonocardia sp. GCM10023141]|uniref:alanine racemase n=1 Tax=Pseudonocardia sp. GCM10023141 TaxID=3252653 RepID=UPI00360D26B5
MTAGEAVIDLAAIGTNVAIARSLTDSMIMAVVKADAFGHGAVPVARAAVAHGAGWLGVASPAEALALRAGGIEAPILSWLYPAATDLREAVAADITLSVATAAQLDAVARAAARVGRSADVHLKIDTGLSRNGATLESWPELVARARAAERAGHVSVTSVWSHLVDADAESGALVGTQIARYTDAIAVAESAGLRPVIKHLANSAGALHRPSTHFDMVRMGIGLYGVEPIPGHETGLRPVMTLRAPIVSLKSVHEGTGVSYHHDYVTRGRTRLALVPLGYADGVPRSAGRYAQVWVGTERRPVAGRIAMDQFVVDVGIRAVEPDHVVVFGPGDRGEPTVTEWAAWAGTIPHEVLTGIGNRVERLYVGGDAATRPSPVPAGEVARAR